jgi:predicted MPP superfamily phosphohydrolase
MLISWRTQNPIPSIVEYGKSVDYDHTLNVSGAVSNHIVTLTGLQPSTQYHYRILAGDTTADYSFSTEVRWSEPFVFAVYGDTRTNHDVHTAVLMRIQECAPRFIINTGDLVSSSTEANWNKYFAILCKNTTVGQTIPIYSTMGNHDTNSLRYYEYLHLPHNNTENTQSYYSFDYGCAHIIALNSLTDYSPGSPQYRWLVDDLSYAKNATFRFVFMHNPVYSSSQHGGSESIQKILSPLFEQYRVQIVFSGHDHGYERTKSINGITYVVTGGGGAPLYNFKSDHDWTAYKEKAYHYCKISIDSTACKFSMIRLDGVISDSLVVSAVR